MCVFSMFEIKNKCKHPLIGPNRHNVKAYNEEYAWIFWKMQHLWLLKLACRRLFNVGYALFWFYKYYLQFQ